MKIIELLYQSIHPSPENRFQNDELSRQPAVYPKQHSLLKGKTNKWPRKRHHAHLHILHIISMPMPTIN